ncbi:MAG: Fic family protein [bacterium]|nr:Fic family protein [bacterium]
MHSLTPAYLEGLRFSALQLETLNRIGEYQGKQVLYADRMPEVLRTMRRIAQIESAESSNRIEGIRAPRKRIQGIVIEHTTPDNRSEQEIAGYRDVLALIHESATDMEVTANVIRQLHAVMYRYLPQPGGTWKMADNEIVERDSTGALRVRFKPVPAVATPQAMDDLASGLRRALYAEERPSLVVAPLVVLDFLCIHPFADGNGRLSRLLTLLLLYRAGHQVGRYISLERVTEESKETYPEALDRSSRGWHEGRHDPHPWLDYFWGVMLRAYGEFTERVGELNRGAGGKAAFVRDAVARMVGPFTLADLKTECPGVSLPTIKRELGAMRDEGLVLLDGRGRGARWRRVS